MKKPCALVLAAALLLPVAGCSAGASGGEGGAVKLTFRQMDEPRQIASLESAVDGWNTQHPDIQVTLETVTGNSAKDQFARESTAKSGPDVIQLPNTWVKDLANPRMLLPLNDLLTTSGPPGGLDDFMAKDMATIGGKTWALPWTVDTLAIAYRPDLLKAAGYETTPGTWDDLLSAAKAMSSGNQYGLCIASGSGADAAQWFTNNYYLWDHGWSFVEKTDSGWRAGVDPDQLASTMDYFNEFFTSKAMPESMIGISSYADPTIIGGLSTGQCAMTVLPPQTFRQAKEQSSHTLLTARVPAGPNGQITHQGGRMLGINANTKHPKEAWEFIKYLESATVFNDGYQQYPASKSVLSKLKIPADESGFTESLPTGRTFQSYAEAPMPISTLQGLVNQEFGAVYSKQKTSEKAAKDLISEINKELSGK